MSRVFGLPLLLILASAMMGQGEPGAAPGPDGRMAGASAAVPLTRATILPVMEKMADAQLALPGYKDGSQVDWVAGAFYVGLGRLAPLAGDGKYLVAEKALAEKAGWEFKTNSGARNIAMADNETIGQLYIDLAVSGKDLSKLDTAKKQWDGILAGFADPTAANVRAWNGDVARDGGAMPWWWCDALFMAPPGLARLSEVTWDRKYLDAMDKAYWQTYDRLYDKTEHLFYRDSKYLTQKTANGKKVFWGRGNGWVFAGLANLLPYVPRDYASRGKYETLFREMAGELAAIQQGDGLWRGSLLDAGVSDLPETSGSAFFCYGMAWGINNGLLERSKYEPVVERAWAKLNTCIRPDGMIGWVQAIGEQPGSSTANSTQAYAVGGFLLAGSEMIRLHEGG